MSTQALIQSIARMARVRCGITPRCMRLSALAANAFVFSAFPLTDSRGSKLSQARVNTARWDDNECNDWCIVILCSRTPLDFAFPSPAVAGSSSKNFRQSSFSPSFSWSPFSSSSDDDSASAVAFFDFLGLGGFEPSSVTHQALSSLCSVGKVERRSRIESKFSAILGYSSPGWLFSRVLINTRSLEKMSLNGSKDVRGFAKEEPPNVVVNTEPSVVKLSQNIRDQQA